MYGSALTMSAFRSFSYTIHPRIGTHLWHATSPQVPSLYVVALRQFHHGPPYPYHYQDEIELLRAIIGPNRHNVRCFINSSQIAERQPACFALLIRFTKTNSSLLLQICRTQEKITMKEKPKQRAVSIFN